MSKEKKIKISVNEEDVQNLIDCYEKDIEYIKQLEKENEELKEKINKAIEYIEKQSYKCMFDLRMDELEELLNILRGE